jgi:hypothetical protein
MSTAMSDRTSSIFFIDGRYYTPFPSANERLSTKKLSGHPDIQYPVSEVDALFVK